jgi:hypothetical protein
MQIKIIHLDSYDDVNSIKDKMSAGKKSQILLVWPIKSSLIEDRLELNLIKRYALSLASPIAIVSKNKTIRKHAEKLEIPIFGSIRKAKNAHPNLFSQTENLNSSTIKYRENRGDWRETKDTINSRRTHTKTPPIATRYITLFVALLSFISLAGILIPNIDIYIKPETTKQILPITLHIRPGLVNYSLSGAIPTYTYSTIVEGQKEIRVTGELVFPIDKASGEIVITNLTDQKLNIPANQIVKTLGDSPEKFLTAEGAEFSGVPGEAILISILAVNPGIEGNIEAELINLMEGDFSLQVAVSNPAVISGGTERSSHGPSNEDYDSLLESLTISLTNSALNEIANSIDAKDTILDIYTTETKILLQEFSPPFPQPSNIISLKMQLSLEVQILSHQTISSLGNQLLDLAIENGYSKTRSPLQITTYTNPYLNDNGEALWDVVFIRDVFKEIDANNLRFNLAGKKITALDNFIEDSLVLGSPVSYEILPSWWPFVPISPLNIEFIYEND